MLAQRNWVNVRLLEIQTARGALRLRQVCNFGGNLARPFNSAVFVYGTAARDGGAGECLQRDSHHKDEVRPPLQHLYYLAEELVSVCVSS